MIACGAALGCYVMNRPVRVCLTLNDCMELVGKRYPWMADYQVGFDQAGKLLAIKMNWYADAGSAGNDKMRNAYKFADNAYNCPNWHIIPNLVKTNTPANTSCRSPGTMPAITIMEHIIESVAKFLNMDSLPVKMINLYKRNDVTPYGQPLPYFNVDQIINDLVKSSDYFARQQVIQVFNRNNRWKKKAISMQPIKWVEILEIS
jgi:xanthine dehydrogenase/oxidase